MHFAEVYGESNEQGLLGDWTHTRQCKTPLSTRMHIWNQILLNPLNYWRTFESEDDNLTNHYMYFLAKYFMKY